MPVLVLIDWDHFKTSTCEKLLRIELTLYEIMRYSVALHLETIEHFMLLFLLRKFEHVSKCTDNHMNHVQIKSFCGHVLWSLLCPGNERIRVFGGKSSHERYCILRKSWVRFFPLEA